MSYYHDNKKLPLDRAFTLNDISFPANWLRLAGAEDKAAQGIEWRDDPALKFKNEKFYYNTVQDGEVVWSTGRQFVQRLTVNATTSTPPPI